MSTRAVRVLLVAALLVPAGPAAAAPAHGGVVGVGPVRLLAPAEAPGEGVPALSRTGRWVVHLQSSTTAAGRARLRVVRTDLVTGEAVLLSRLPDGRPAGRNHSQEPMGSSDGRYALLQTDARLTADDTDTGFDAFVRDVEAGVTRRISGGDGSVGTAALSGDGRSAVFTSSGTDLVPGSTGRNVDVYLRDLVGGGVQQVTVRPDGSPSRGSAQEADVDARGSVVVFTSRADDLAEADDDGGLLDLFVRDVSTGTTRWIGGELPGEIAGLAVSPDGREVVSRGDDGAVRLTRTSTGATRVVAAQGQIGARPFSADGRLLALVSDTSVLLHDTRTGTAVPLPVPAGGFPLSTALSGDGRLAAYAWAPEDGGPVRTYLVAVQRAR